MSAGRPDLPWSSSHRRGGGGARAVVTDDAHVAAADVDLDRTVVVGPEAAHAVGGDSRHGHLRRVTVGVPGPHRGDCGLCTGAAEQGKGLVGRAVVRHLDDVGVEPGATIQECLLRGRFDVSGEQDGQRWQHGPKDDRVVVGVAVRAVQHHLRRDHRSGDVPHRERVAGGDPLHRNVSGGGPALHPGPLPRWLLERSHVDGVHLASLQDTGQAFDMVGVQMAEHDQRHVTDVQVIEAALHPRWIRAGVDDDRARRAGPQHQPIPLADIARDEGPLLRCPRAGRQPGSQDGDQYAGHRSSDHPAGGPVPERKRGADRTSSERQTADCAL